jgi:hypothetical protein
VGVKQGDAMAPVLFLFLMQAFAKTLEDSWEEAEIKVPTFNYHRNRDNPIGRLVNQRSQSKGTLLLLNNLLYVDDGAFIFTNKSNMIKSGRNHIQTLCMLRAHHAHRKKPCTSPPNP